MEIELKYQVPENLKVNDLNMEDSKVFNMRAIYFDTEDSKLYKKKMSFRIRYENDNLICTVKFLGHVINGLHVREEINIPCDEKFLANPTYEILKETKAYDSYKEVIKDDKLVPLLEMKYVRHEKVVEYKKTSFNLTFDDGIIESIKGTVKIHEMEVELIDGNESDIVSFGEKLKEKYNLSIQNRSKLERVYDLLYKN